MGNEHDFSQLNPDKIKTKWYGVLTKFSFFGINRKNIYIYDAYT